jgi:phosphatidylserine/phosphatidylglycerophosphate/cardiolipin synthase-like enzyme
MNKPPDLRTARSPIILPGRNCWSVAPTDAAGLLIDGRSYYRAFYRAAREAKRYLLIAGWRFNSDVRLVRGDDARRIGGEVHFLPLLNRLCENNPDLRIYILAWDFGVIFIHEWEGSQEQLFQQAAHGRLQFRYDNQHAVGASHHQKFAVVDGQIGFVGGLDFNADDWDDRRHLAHHPERHDSGEKQHDPYHDVQGYVAGPAAVELADYFKTRWQAATGEELKLPAPPREPPAFVKPAVSIVCPTVALSRNVPKIAADADDRAEIRQLYLDAIAAAEELIYIENQYFSSQIACDALVERMQATSRPPLDIVMILPKRFPSWTEAATLGPLQLRHLDRLREVARETGHRLGVYYSTATTPDGGEVEEVNVVVHSKLMVVDDRLLTVGSCNTSNRSMGLDTELNLTWEASERREICSIQRARVSLLAEHCGLRRPSVVRSLRERKTFSQSSAAALLRHSRRQLGQTRGLVEYLDRIADRGEHRLRHLTREALLEDRRWLEQLERLGVSFDPGQPLIELYTS